MPVKLATLVSKGIDCFDYVYDFGDNWEHAVVVESVAEADPGLKYPRLLAGGRRGPPEDVGGPPGFFDFIEAATNPHHPEHRRLIEWYCGPYDPDDLDLQRLRLRLGAIAKYRHGGTVAYDKPRRKS